MKPLWQIRSGKYAGCRQGDLLYDAGGRNVGYFVGDAAYSLRGQYVGEVHAGEWIGKRTGMLHPTYGSRAAGLGISAMPRGDRAGLSLTGWEDADLSGA